MKRKATIIALMLAVCLTLSFFGNGVIQAMAEGLEEDTELTAEFPQDGEPDGEEPGDQDLSLEESGDQDLPPEEPGEDPADTTADSDLPEEDEADPEQDPGEDPAEPGDAEPEADPEPDQGEEEALPPADVPVPPPAAAPYRSLLRSGTPMINTWVVEGSGENYIHWELFPADAAMVAIWRNYPDQGNAVMVIDYIYDATVLEYTDTTVLPGYTYSYEVYFLDGFEEVVAKGGPVKPSDLYSKPENLAAAPLDHERIELTWSKPTIGLPPTGYTVYVYSDATGDYEFLKDVTGTSYIHEGLQAETQYSYKVTARFDSAESDPAGPASATTGSAPIVVGEPLDVSAVAYDYDKIKISWTPIADVDGYIVYRLNEQTGAYEKIDTLAQDAAAGVFPSESHDLGRLPETTYYYKVSAYLGSREGNPVGPVNATTPAQVGQLLGLKAEAYAYDKIEVSWNTLDNVDGYKIFRLNDATGDYEWIATVYQHPSQNIFPTSYHDLNRLPSTTYSYKACAIKGSTDGPLAGPVSATTPSRLTAPQAVTAEAVDAYSIKVSWTAVDSALGYYVYRSDSADGTYEYVGTTTSTSLINSGLTPDTGYYYKVVAYDADIGPMSEYAYAKTHELIQLKAPTCVSAWALDSSRIQVSWNRVTNAEGYYIYRSATANGTYEYVGTSTATSYIDTGLASSTTYYYKVAAYKGTFTGALSNYACATTKAGLKAPLCLSAKALDTSRIQVSWNRVTGATGYYIYRANSPGGTYEFVGTSTTTGYIDTGLSAGTTYYYKVAAFNASGTGALSGYVYATTKQPVKLKAPACVSAYALDSSRIQVKWNSVSGALGYYVYRSGSANGDYVYVGTASSTSYIDTGLAPSTKYYYRVVAYDANGIGVLSNYACATTKAAIAVPGCVSAKALGASSIQVSWSRVSGATGYYIYRAGSANGTYEYVGTSFTTSFTDTGLASSTRYFYKVAAFNATGTSGLSNYASATTCAALRAPTGVSACALDANRIKVSWTKVSGASGYYVYRASSAGGNYVYVGSSTSTAFTDTGLAPDTGYYYKVAAYSGNETGALSGYAYARTKGGLKAPTCVSACATGYNSIKVSWSKVSGATGYYVYRATSPGGNYTYVGSTKSLCLVNYCLTPGTTYYYKVVAYNGTQNSPMSNYACATTWWRWC